MKYRAYELISGWRGPIRATIAQCNRDIARHGRSQPKDAVTDHCVIEPAPTGDLAVRAGTTDYVWEGDEPLVTFLAPGENHAL